MLLSELKKLTKSEIMVLDLIKVSDEYDYSAKETSDILDISKRTVYRALKKLLNLGFVSKESFFVGKIKRNKYKKETFCSSDKLGKSKKETLCTSDKLGKSKNVTIQNVCKNKNVTIQNVAQHNAKKISDNGISQRWVKSLWHKKEPSRKTRLTQNLINDLDIYNINNINNISNQSNNTMVLRTCQEEKSNFFKKIDKIFIDMTKSSITSAFKRVIKKISCEKNENSQNVKKFINEYTEQDINDVILSAVQSVTRRLSDKTKEKIRNIYGYIRMVIINAVQAFYASQIDESEIKTLLYESVKQLAGRPAPSYTYNSPASSSKIDTRYLARNFPQREYSEEYLESFYETFEDEPSIPATSIPVRLHLQKIL